MFQRFRLKILMRNHCFLCRLSIIRNLNAYNNCSRIVEGLRTQTKYLQSCAATKNVEEVKQHLAAGNDVNQNNVVDQTPLHYASASGGKEMSDHLKTKMWI